MGIFYSKVEIRVSPDGKQSVPMIALPWDIAQKLDKNVHLRVELEGDKIMLTPVKLETKIVEV